MKFTAKLGELQAAVATAAKGSAASGIRPNLANLLIEVHGDEARVVGTDLEIMLVTRVSIQSEENGSVAVSAKLLQEILAGMAADKGAGIRLFLDEDLVRLHISCGRNKASLPTFESEAMPPVVDMTKAAPALGLPPEFAGILGSASIAIDSNNSNPALNGLLLEIEKDGQIALAATDSKRMAVVEIKLDSVPEKLVGRHVLPARAVAELARVLSQETGTMLELRDNQLVFTTPAVVLITRLIDAKFPDFRRIMPKDTTRTMRADRKGLIASLKAVAPIASRSSQMVRFDIGKLETTVWAESAEDGRAETMVPVILEGDPINIAFNARFMLDFLAATDAEEIDLAMTTPSYPGVMRPHVDGDSFRYVIMPMSA